MTTTEPTTLSAVCAAFLETCKTLPEKVELPYEYTPEGQRMASFKQKCPAEFCAKIDRTKLTNATAFDRVAQWDGSFPGPLAFGATGAGKSRAAWSALGRLYVKNDRRPQVFTAKALIGRFSDFDDRGDSTGFFRYYSDARFFLIDDLDKVNWQFESTTEALFAFYDWIYVHQKPCITTTNKDRAWWAKKMSDAFARRLFDACHTPVQF